jgi:hypothetical protein
MAAVAAAWVAVAEGVAAVAAAWVAVADFLLQMVAAAGVDFLLRMAEAVRVAEGAVEADT